jgi:hypothetical protein
MSKYTVVNMRTDRAKLSPARVIKKIPHPERIKQG